MYFSFHCDISTSQLNFETPGGTYQVIDINPETQKFMIHSRDKVDCDNHTIRDRLLNLNQSSPFHLTGWCSVEQSSFGADAPLKSGVEIELRWEPPLEPLCSSSMDCKEWPNTTCNTTTDGKNRCLCNTNFIWDGLNTNCTLGKNIMII